MIECIRCNSIFAPFSGVLLNDRSQIRGIDLSGRKVAKRWGADCGKWPLCRVDFCQSDQQPVKAIDPRRMELTDLPDQRFDLLCDIG